LQSHLPSVGHIPDQQAGETDNEFTQLIVLSPQSIEIRLERMNVVLGNAAVVVRALDDVLRHGGPSYPRQIGNRNGVRRKRRIESQATNIECRSLMATSGQSQNLSRDRLLDYRMR
jgi:hypothetical protein